jgi:murein hydrolase activator
LRRQRGVRAREFLAERSFLDKTSGYCLRLAEERISTGGMTRGRLQTSAHVWALTITASLCCALPPRAADAGESALSVLIRAKAKKKKDDIDIEQARKLFEEHQRNLERIQKEQQDLENESKELDADRASLQGKLINAGRKAQESDKRLTEIETQLAKLTAQEADIRVALSESRATIAQMLGVMERMGREPPPILATRRSDALKMVRSAMVLSSFFPKFKDESDRLASRLAELDKVLADSHEQQTRLAAEKEQSSHVRDEITALLAERREKLKGNYARIEELKVAASRHTQAVTDLGDLLQRLDAEVAQKSNLAAYEEELKRLGPIVELKPEAKQVAFVEPGRLKPALPFDKVKGQLPIPCAGKKIKAFGTRDETGGKSEGIVIETRSDTQIVSPSDGWVIYAGQFRSYGQLLIINAGGGYHILLAGMDQIYTSVGQFVLAGEPVAVMGKPKPEAADGASSRSPSLYIEFRKDARPVDPDPWWSQGVKEG